jgi:acylphosphatase
MEPVYRESVHFTGHVQGVGFRYAASQVAKEFEVTGFVTNLPDGRVHIEAEGRREEVDSFVRAVEDRMHGYIRKIERKSAEGPSQFKGFSIR